MQSHAFHLTITAVVGMALYQGVTALARNEVTIDFWAGVLIVSAVSILILPILGIPFIFGGITAKPLARDRMNFRAKVSHRLENNSVSESKSLTNFTELRMPAHMQLKRA